MVVSAVAKHRRTKCHPSNQPPRSQFTRAPGVEWAYPTPGRRLSLRRCARALAGPRESRVAGFGCGFLYAPGQMFYESDSEDLGARGANGNSDFA
jgi:hypothetical protein